MRADEPGATPDRRPPLGSWPRVYLLVAAVALLIIALLWALSATYHVAGRA
jgi:hypothetical protein